MKTGWKETPLLSKIVSISSIIIAIAVIVLGILQIFDVWSYAPHIYMPLMGVNLLLQAYTQWKTNRGVAIFSLCAAVFVFICTVVVISIT